MSDYPHKEIERCPVCGSENLKQRYKFHVGCASFNVNPYEELGCDCLDCGTRLIFKAANRNKELVRVNSWAEAENVRKS